MSVDDGGSFDLPGFVREMRGLSPLDSLDAAGFARGYTLGVDLCLRWLESACCVKGPLGPRVRDTPHRENVGCTLVTSHGAFDADCNALLLLGDDATVRDI
jgi:hypothetical protein